MEAVDPPLTFIRIYQTTRRNNPGDRNLDGNGSSGSTKGHTFLNQLSDY
jgi:hypothetical protein